MVMWDLTAAGTSQPHISINWQHGNLQKAAIRKGNFKLVITNDEVEFFDLNTDLAEEHDISTAQPALTRELLEDWKSWDSKNPALLWKSVPREEWVKDEYQYASYPYLKGHHHYKAEE
jgi:hypothetical protein